MPWGWSPRGGGGPVPPIMAVRDNFFRLLREKGDGLWFMKIIIGNCVTCNYDIDLPFYFGIQWVVPHKTAWLL
jgi:hypothetical protein